MSQANVNSQIHTCPQCDNHCPVDALQCGKGRKYFGETNGGHDRGHRRCHEPHIGRDDLAGKFERCGRLISHCLGTRRGQGKILHTLCQRGEMQQRELQELLGIQAGSMSEIAAKLESKGLITRVRSETDRRKVSLSITEQGRARAALGDEEHILRRRAELFSSLSLEEQDTLKSLLDKLSADWTQRLERRDRTDEQREDCSNET